jgi:hypothetical protein
MFYPPKPTGSNKRACNTALIEEWAIINGDSATNPLCFDGLVKQITTNTETAGDAAFTLSQLNTLLKKIAIVGGKPQCIVLSYRDNQRFSDLILSSYYRMFQQGAGALADVPAGVAITKWVSPFGTLDIIGSRFLPNTGHAGSILVLDDKTVLDDGNALQMVKYGQPSINTVNSVKSPQGSRPSQASLAEEGVETINCGHPKRKGGQPKGCIPWNKGKKGVQVAWSKGLTKETSESLRRLSERLIGHSKLGDCGSYERIPEIKAKNRLSQLGKYDGDKNPNYQGGISSFYDEQWSVEEQKAWTNLKRQCYERDNFKCTICGSTKNIQAHHIIPYRVVRKHELGNLTTLCKFHHRKVDNFLRRKGCQDIVRTATIDKIAELCRNVIVLHSYEWRVTNGIKCDLMPISSIDLALLQSAYRTLIAEFTVLQMTCESFQGQVIHCA